MEREELVSTLASPADLDQVRRNPLLRARACLEHVLAMDNLSGETANAARLSLTYIMLAFGEYRQALDFVLNTFRLSLLSQKDSFLPSL